MKKNPLVESKWPPLDAHQWWTCPIIYQVHNLAVVKLNSGKSRVYNNIGLVVKQVNVSRVFIVTKQFFSLFELDRMLSDTPSTWNGCAAASCKLFVFSGGRPPSTSPKSFHFLHRPPFAIQILARARARDIFFKKFQRVTLFSFILHDPLIRHGSRDSISANGASSVTKIADKTRPSVPADVPEAEILLDTKQKEWKQQETGPHLPLLVSFNLSIKRPASVFQQQSSSSEIRFGQLFCVSILFPPKKLQLFNFDISLIP